MKRSGLKRLSSPGHLANGIHVFYPQVLPSGLIQHGVDAFCVMLAMSVLIEGVSIEPILLGKPDRQFFGVHLQARHEHGFPVFQIARSYG